MFDFQCIFVVILIIIIIIIITILIIIIIASIKLSKYLTISQTHIFIPVALETMGPIDAEGLRVLYELVERLVYVSGDLRESSFLFQRLSVLVQRFNMVAFRDTFNSQTASEISHSNLSF